MVISMIIMAKYKVNIDKIITMFFIKIYILSNISQQSEDNSYKNTICKGIVSK